MISSRNIYAKKGHNRKQEVGYHASLSKLLLITPSPATRKSANSTLTYHVCAFCRALPHNLPLVSPMIVLLVPVLT